MFPFPIIDPQNFYLSGALAFLSTDSLFINFFGADTEHWCAVPQLQDLPFKVQVEK